MKARLVSSGAPPEAPPLRENPSSEQQVAGTAKNGPERIGMSGLILFALSSAAGGAVTAWLIG